MKKFCKLLTVILVLAFFVLTPGMTTVSSCLANLAPASIATHQFEAPTQNKDRFTFDTESFDALTDLSSWTKPTDNGVVSQQITTGVDGTNAKFIETYKDNYNTLTDTQISDYSPYVIINATHGSSAKGFYTTNAITLQADAHYIISVKYYVIEERNTDANNTKYAFGTFYLNEKKITLLPQNKWDTATFYVTTDKLEQATVTPKLYLGDDNKKALGAIYFTQFTISAVNEKDFYKAQTNNTSAKESYDFGKLDKEYILVESFDNDDFTPTEPSTNAYANNETILANIPNDFETRDYFHNKDGNDNTVMLMKATNSNAGFTLKDYTFEPQPHEVYMFQFYSIATAALDFTGFYFMIGETSYEITNLTDYPYHNGWQLNVIFFIAGQKLNSEYELKFMLSNNTTPTTGWACIDEFRIYQVNGSYANKNQSLNNVHKFVDQNTEAPALDITNGNFDLGSAADNVTATNSTYPYPLIADSWNHDADNKNIENGIINLHVGFDDTLWDERFGTTYPGVPSNSDDNNHVYMMHNLTATQNTVTSPIITTTAGETTYISFDAYSTTETQTRAYIFTAETDENGNFKNKVTFNEKIEINDGTWRRYEFAITESKYASSRNYYLCFEMTGEGFAYIDNVRKPTVATPSAVSTAIDVNNTLALNDVWQTTDKATKNATATGLVLENYDKAKAVIENTFSYNLTTDAYYELQIEARGKNAYLGFNQYDGLLQVTTDAVDPESVHTYKIYLQAKDGATTVNFQITLGYVNENDKTDVSTLADGDIFISNIKFSDISEDEYNLAKETATNNPRIKFLTTVNQNENNDNNDTEGSNDNNFFGENWWYLLPSLITALALLLGIMAFLLRKIKFDKHITKKHTSYARDMRLKNQKNKIVAQKATKVDNITDEPQNN